MDAVAVAAPLTADRTSADPVLSGVTETESGSLDAVPVAIFTNGADVSAPVTTMGTTSPMATYCPAATPTVIETVIAVWALGHDAHATQTAEWFVEVSA
jgi:hypothetical protein